MYDRHRRAGEPPCPACREANTEYYRRRNEIRKLEEAIENATSLREKQELEKQRRALFSPRERAAWEEEEKRLMDRRLGGSKSDLL